MTDGSGLSVSGVDGARLTLWQPPEVFTILFSGSSAKLTIDKEGFVEFHGEEKDVAPSALQFFEGVVMANNRKMQELLSAQ